MTEVIKHYGKRGMKWGVRSSKKSSGDGKSAGEKAKVVGEKAKAVGKAALPVAKKIAGTGVKVGAMAGLVSLGVPAAVAGVAVASVASVHPEVIGFGKELTKQVLNESGLKKMGTIEKEVSDMKINAYRAHGKLEEEMGGRHIDMPGL